MMAGVCKNLLPITSVVQVLDEATSTYALNSVFNSSQYSSLPCINASSQDALCCAPVKHPKKSWTSCQTSSAVWGEMLFSPHTWFEHPRYGKVVCDVNAVEVLMLMDIKFIWIITIA